MFIALSVIRGRGKRTAAAARKHPAPVAGCIGKAPAPWASADGLVAMHAAQRQRLQAVARYR